jgi:hypothetical protein
MTPADYRIESNHPISGRLLPVRGEHSFNSRDLAITTAAKSTTKPSGQEIRVVHVPTGEVVFRKSTPRRAEFADEQ